VAFLKPSHELLRHGMAGTPQSKTDAQHLCTMLWDYMSKDGLIVAASEGTESAPMQDVQDQYGCLATDAKHDELADLLSMKQTINMAGFQQQIFMSMTASESPCFCHAAHISPLQEVERIARSFLINRHRCTVSNTELIKLARSKILS